MRFPITMDQHADIMILGENDPPFGDSFSQQSPITRIRRSFAEIDDVVAGSAHIVDSLRHDVGIGE